MRDHFWYFLLVLSVLGMCVAGCPHPTPTPVNPTPDQAVDLAPAPLGDFGSTNFAACPTNVTVKNSDVCDGMFTDDKHGALSCVKCTGGQGCLDVDVQVYCVTSTCLGDTNCSNRSNMSWGSKKPGGKKK